MRILILHSRYLSGDASGENRVVADEAKLLSDAGHQVTLWQPFVKRTTGLSLVKTGMDAVASFEAAAAVRRAVRSFRPEIVHCHNLFPNLSPAVIRAGHAEGSTVVLSLHNYRLLCLPATFLRDGGTCEDCLGRAPWPGVVHRCYRGSALGSAAIASSLIAHRSARTFDLPAMFLAVSPFVREKHIAAGFPASKVQVKSNFAWGVPRRKGPGEYFMFLGRLSEEKGLQTVLDAWHGRSHELRVVGDGPIEERLRAMAPSAVRFEGAVDPSHASVLLRRARALVVPSIWYEAQPRVILEAYAAGVPVLASRIGGLPDVVADDASGFLLRPNDPESWRDGVNRLLDDDTSERLGEGAYQLWQDRFSPERGLADLEQAYAAALAAR